MNQTMSRVAAAAGAAVASVVLFGGAAQAGEPKNQDGPDGPPGTAITVCRDAPPPEDNVLQCRAWGGAPGAGGQATADY
ncbi:MAG: hypothetical protein ACRDQ0_22790 [Pseudonocardia sp.]